MFKNSAPRKAWALLAPKERRRAIVVLVVVLAGAVMEAAMVGSVMPFLSILANPDHITKTPAISFLYSTFGFSSRYDFLVAMALSCIGMIVVTNLFLMFRTRLALTYATLCSHTLSFRLMTTFLRQPYEFFLDRHSGSLAKGILTEADLVVTQFLMPFVSLVASFFTVTAIVVLLVWIDPMVAVVSILTLGGLYAATYTFSRRKVKRLGAERIAANGKRFRLVSEVFSGIKDIKVLGRETTYVRNFQAPSLFMARAAVSIGIISEYPRYIVQTAAFGGVILLCLLLVDRNAFDTGSSLKSLVPLMGVFAFAGQRLMPALQGVYSSLTQIRNGSAAVESVYDDLVAGAKGEDLPDEMPHPMGLRSEISLESATYVYPNSEGAGISDLSLSIAKGEKIGIVGSTGAGKTTFADIILGLIPLQKGALKIDGVQIDECNVRSWQQSVGYVPQNIFLVDASFAENIALGTPMDLIDMERVKHCAKVAQIDDFIEGELRDGYKTRVGEQGVRLSGGQKQRVGIARALYHDADLIVFDEATSALDNLTERDLMAAIETIPGDKTILMIAHRLSTVRNCDKILILDRGRLAGFGPWDKLVKQNPTFQKMADLSSTE